MNIADKFTDGAPALVFWSFRYFIGRMTAATCSFAEELAVVWDEIPENYQDLIKRDLEEAFEKNRTGHDCDRAAWQKVRNKYLTKEN